MVILLWALLYSSYSKVVQIWPGQGQVTIFLTQGKGMPLCFSTCQQSSIYSRITCLPYQMCPFPFGKPHFIFHTSFCFAKNISQHGNRLFVYFLPYKKQSHGFGTVIRKMAREEKSFCNFYISPCLNSSSLNLLAKPYHYHCCYFYIVILQYQNIWIAIIACQFQIHLYFIWFLEVVDSYLSFNYEKNRI